MASFHAELHLAGASYRVVRCHYACHQPTDARGRVNAKVRHALLRLALDVPESDALLAWAADPFKALAGEVVFYDAAQLVAHETIAFATGQCVGYHETFESGAGHDGAYVCQLSITAPEFELRTGGPAALAAIMAAVASASTAANTPARALTSASLAALSTDAWLVDLETVIGSGDVRTLVATWVAGGLSEQMLKSAIRGAVDKKLVFQRLRDAKRGIFQQRVVVDDYQNIPGVAAKPYIPNGLPSAAIPASNFGVNDPGFDLPAWNAPTFTGKPILTEVKPGEKLYRVTNDPVSEPFAKTGGYWTRTPPSSLSEVIDGTAVMPEWNNFQKVYEFTAPPYADAVNEEPKFYIWEGPAAAQPVSGDYPEKQNNGYCLPGGAIQAFVPNKLARSPQYDFGKHIVDVTSQHKSW